MLGCAEARMRRRFALMEKKNAAALKHLFGSALLKRLANAIAAVDPAFDQRRFLKLAPKLKLLEMKPRVQVISAQLYIQLPKDYKKAVLTLKKAVLRGKLTGFDLWPLTDFVQTHGLADLELSLDVLGEFTQHFTAEWAIRPFLIQHPEKTLQHLVLCAQSENVHLRRWASEGTRPRLPWGERLVSFISDPAPTLPILESLKFDDELYVRKSVANHLNDISKDHPSYVIKLLRLWKSQATKKKEHRAKINWIINRSLRTLIKQGHKEALALIGVLDPSKLVLSELRLKKKSIALGQCLEFEFVLASNSKRPQKVVIDYILHFVKANGQTTPKVFKLKTFTIASSPARTFMKRHNIVQVTTRKYYEGIQKLSIQVNGTVLAEVPWRLTL
jgi:3-methyladenine DNA glycosylase AlkC